MNCFKIMLVCFIQEANTGGLEEGHEKRDQAHDGQLLQVARHISVSAEQHGSDGHIYLVHNPALKPEVSNAQGNREVKRANCDTRAGLHKSKQTRRFRRSPNHFLGVLVLSKCAFDCREKFLKEEHNANGRDGERLWLGRQHDGQQSETKCHLCSLKAQAASLRLAITLTLI